MEHEKISTQDFLSSETNYNSKIITENHENQNEFSKEESEQESKNIFDVIENESSSTESKTEQVSADSEPEASKIGVWDDILGSGNVLKKMLVEGMPNTKPQKAYICTINYKLMKEDETVIEQGNDVQIQLGDLEVIQGVEVILPTMNDGEKCQLLIEPHLAFGSLGLEPGIPPNSKVLYEIELIKSEPEEDIELLSFAQRKQKGNDKRIKGNWWYARGECGFAIQCYRRALDYLDEVEGGITNPLPDNYDPKDHEITDAALQDLLEDRLNVCNNMAAAQIKLEAYNAALLSLQTVLRCQPNNIKALYRKSKIFRLKNDTTEALKCLNKAKQLEPDNKIILKEIQEINVILQKHKMFEKELAKRMFSNETSENDDKRSNNSKHTSGSKSYLVPVAVAVLAVSAVLFAAWRSKV